MQDKSQTADTPSKSPRPRFYDPSRPLHKVLSLSLVAVGVLLGFFLYFPGSGILGKFVSDVLFGCFSLFAYGVPVLILLHGILWRVEVEKHLVISHGLYALAFLCLANALWYTFLPEASVPADVDLLSFYTRAQVLEAPGLLGAVLGYALRYLTGIVGAPLLSAFVLLLFFYHFIGITPKNVSDAIRRSKQKKAQATRKQSPATLASEEAPASVDDAIAAPEEESSTSHATQSDKPQDKPHPTTKEDKRQAKIRAKEERQRIREEKKRAKKKAQEERDSQGALSPTESGYYPETDETFDEIRRRMEIEERRYQKQSKKGAKAPSSKGRHTSTPTATSASVTPAAATPRRAAPVDIPLTEEPIGAPRTVPTPVTTAVDATKGGESISADDVFQGFDPLSTDTLVGTGAPIWRKADIDPTLQDPTTPAPTPAASVDKSTIHATEGGVVSESGGTGSYRIEAHHMDIPSSRSLHPAYHRPVKQETPRTHEPEYTTDISDLLEDIENESRAKGGDPVSSADTPAFPGMPTPEVMQEAPVTPLQSGTPVPDKEAVPGETSVQDTPVEQTYSIHHYTPPSEQTDESVTSDATSHVVDHNHEVKGDDKTPGRRSSPDYSSFAAPALSLLSQGNGFRAGESDLEISDMINRLVGEFRKFKYEIKVHDVTIGPRITRYSISPPDGVRINSITGLAGDIALGLAVKSIRIEPVPGTPYLGVEIPNSNPSSVPLSSLIDSEPFRKAKTVTTIPLGASVTGKPVMADLCKMPHVLVAGATGMGKSVFLNSLLISLLYHARPDEVKLILVDPKRVELSMYNGIPHLLIPPVVDPQKAAGALIWAVGEMERRYHLMESVGMRTIEGYNQVVKRDPSRGEIQPKIIIAIDELNDLMMQARDAVEPAIMSIAQKARAAGIHLILCTQRPSVDVITGVIKANIPSRIALHVSSGTDSRTILDFYGAEKLLDKGDMLAAIAGSEPIRVQSAFVSDEEVEAVTTYLKQNAGPNVYDEIINSQIESETEKYKNSGKKADRRDEDAEPTDGSIFEDSKFVEACHVAFENGKISTSLLQRSCSLGYGRAAKYIDIMQSLGIVSAPDGPRPRDVLMTRDQFMELVQRETYSGE